MPEQRTERVFTRADIMKHFNKTHSGQRSDNSTWEVLTVSLLPDVSPPIWVLEYKVIHPGPPARSYYLQSLIQQLPNLRRGYYLSWVETTELPVGCTTPQEEDAELARRDALL